MPIRKRNSGYQADYIATNGQRVRRSFTLRKDAKAFIEANTPTKTTTKNGPASVSPSPSSSQPSSKKVVGDIAAGLSKRPKRSSLSVAQ